MSTAFATVPVTEVPREVFNKYEGLTNVNKVILASDTTDGLFEIAYATDNSETIGYDGADVSVVALGTINKIVSTNGGDTWGAEVVGTTTIAIEASTSKIVYANKEVTGTPGFLTINNYAIAQASLTAYNSALAAITESEFTPASWTIYQGVVSSNIVTVENLQSEVDTATSAITTAQGNLVLRANFMAYNNVIATVVETNYTVASWTTYQGIVDGLGITFDSNQATVDSAATAITTVQGNLVLRANFTTYNTTIAAATQANYTIASWTTYQGIVDTNVVTTESTQGEVDTATTNIAVAQTNLVEKADLTAYTTALSAVVEADYTIESWGIYNAIVSANVMTTENTQEEVGIAVDNILLAQADLVLKTNLTTYNTALAAVTAVEYTTESWLIYDGVVTTNVVTEANTQAEVDIAVNNITTAQGALVFAAQAEFDTVMAQVEALTDTDYLNWFLVTNTFIMPETSNTEISMKTVKINEALTELIAADGDMALYNAALASVVESDYTADSWLEYQGVVSINIVTTTDLQSKIDSAKSAIVTSQENNLIAIPGDLTAYNATLALVTEADYVVETWTDYALVLANNIATVGDLQSVVNTKVVNITTAQGDLVLVIKANLQFEIDSAAALTSTDYTVGTWSVLTTALSLPETTNIEIIDKTDAINNARKDLEFVGQADFKIAEDVALTKTLSDYTLASVSPLVDALILPVSTNAEVIIKTTAINDAVAGLVPIPADITEWSDLADLVGFEGDYEPASLNAYIDAIVLAGANEASITDLQSVVNAKRDILIVEQAKLIKLTPDLTGYNNLVNLIETDYTPETWLVYEQVLSDNIMTADSLISKVADTVLIITGAKAGLVQIQANIMPLSNLIDGIDTDRNKYTAESFLLYIEALGDMQYGIADLQSSVDAKYQTVLNAKKLLIAVEDGALIEALDRHYEVVTELLENDYTVESWVIYEGIIAANEVTGTNTIEEINLAVSNILAARENLEAIPGDLVDYQELLDSLVPTDYTTASWEEYQLVVNVNSMMTDNLQSEIAIATENITKAQAKLIKKPTSDRGSSGGSDGGNTTPTVPVITVPVKPVEPVVIKVGENTVTIKETIDIKAEIKGYIKGYSDNTFKPNNTITRAETSQMLANILENSGMIKPEIKDVEGQWYSEAVEKITSLGVMKGYEDKTFKPDNNLTRQEFAVTLVNLLDLSSMTVKTNKEFTDVKDIYGKEAIELLASLGVIDGYPDGTFRPNSEITRAEVVVMFNRLLGENIGSGLGTYDFTDIKGTWAEAEIIRALGK